MGIELEISDLVVHRGGRVVIDGLSSGVVGGQALLLTGANGAGKTTLIRTIAGLAQPSRGVINLRCDGTMVGEEGIGPQCHYIGHLNAAKPAMSVRENLVFWQKFLGGGEDISTVLAVLNLENLDSVPVRYLSAGQQRRVALARLLVAKRPVWLLDEPSVSLDAASVTKLTEIGNTHLLAGGIIVAATHLSLAFEPATELQLLPVVPRFEERDEVWA